MIDLILTEESIDRSMLVAPFGQPLKTRAVYALCPQLSATSHLECLPIMQWFARQAEQGTVSPMRPPQQQEGSGSEQQFFTLEIANHRPPPPNTHPGNSPPSPCRRPAPRHEACGWSSGTTPNARSGSAPDRV